MIRTDTVSNPRLRNLISSLLVLLSLQVVSCQHFDDITPEKPTEISPYARSFFGSCFPADGGISIQWYQNQSLLVDTEADWISETFGSWQVQMIDPIGRMVLDLAWKNRILSLKGPMKKKIPKMEIGDEGYFKVKGILVGLKVGELPCLLKSDFPASWLEKIYERKNLPSGEVLKISEETRKIDMIVLNKDGPDGEKICATLEWKNLWGLKSTSVRWCQVSKGKSGFLDLPEGHRIKWNNLDA